uniref:Inosine triphosphate pyrophosphatase n=1 Tax=Parastrongyloides trichosuri TaxID=131310 RepID=A0A0N4Z6J6_PARTI
MSKKVIKFVTGNSNKLKEVQNIFGSNKHFSVEAVNLDLPEYQASAEEIVTKKCHLACEQVSGPIIIEDTSLYFKALGGLPGPYIKWFLKELKPEGLAHMASLYPTQEAYAQCIFAYCEEKGSEVLLFKGIINGKIVAPRGETTFGWDPIFQPNGYDVTFAEMDKEIKNKISHRSIALQKLFEYLEKKY